MIFAVHPSFSLQVIGVCGYMLVSGRLYLKQHSEEKQCESPDLAGEVIRDSNDCSEMVKKRKRKSLKKVIQTLRIVER